MSLNNNTVSKRIDEMAKDVETQLAEKMVSKKFSIQMDESIVRNSEAVLMSYVRYIMTMVNLLKRCCSVKH
jgi:hypothetical protein